MKKKKVAVSLMLTFLMLFSVNVFAADNSNFLEGYQTEPDFVKVFCSNIGEAESLDKTQFEVSLGGEIVNVTEVKSVEEVNVPITFYCMVDISGSMNSYQMKQAKDAMKSICDGLGEQDNMVIGAMGDDLNVSDYLSDKEAIYAAIDGIKVIKEQNTNLYEGIVNGIKSLTSDTKANPKKCLLVMSDGKDYQTTGITKEEAEKVVTDSGVAVYTIATLKKDPSKTMIESAKVLGSFARISTGGMHVAPVLDGVSGAEAGSSFLDNAKSGAVLTLDCADYDTNKDELLLRVIFHESEQSVKEDTMTVYSEDLQYSPEPPEPEPTIPIPVLIGIGVGVLLVIVIIAIVLSKKKKEKKTVEDTEMAEVKQFTEEPVVEQNATEPVAEPVKPEPVVFASTANKVRFVAIGYEHIQFVAEFPNQVWTTVGRDNRSQVVLNPTDKKLSGVHCSIRYMRDMLQIRDENSSNGTFVNGVPIKNMGVVSVMHRNKIRMGSYEYRVLLKEEEE